MEDLIVLIPLFAIICCLYKYLTPKAKKISYVLIILLAIPTLFFTLSFVIYVYLSMRGFYVIGQSSGRPEEWVIEKQDPTLCRKVIIHPLEFLPHAPSGTWQSACFSDVAKKMKDPKICDYLSYQKFREDCISEASR